MDEVAIPVPASRLEQRYDMTVAAQAEEVLELRRSRSRARWGEGSLLVVVLALAIALLIVIPAVRFVPVFVYLDSNGLQQSATTISDLPPDTRVAAIEAALWTYTRHCEHYSPSEGDYSYGVCSAMSSDRVRQTYQTLANPKLNKDAPAIKVGQRGFIRVYRRSGKWSRDHDADYSAGVYQMTFCKVISDGQSMGGQMVEATVAYRLISRVPLWERVTFNAPGVQVMEYRAEPITANKSIAPASLGNDNPCA